MVCSALVQFLPLICVTGLSYPGQVNAAELTTIGIALQIDHLVNDYTKIAEAVEKIASVSERPSKIMGTIFSITAHAEKAEGTASSIFATLSDLLPKQGSPKPKQELPDLIAIRKGFRKLRDLLLKIDSKSSYIKHLIKSTALHSHFDNLQGTFQKVQESFRRFLQYPNATTFDELTERCNESQPLTDQNTMVDYLLGGRFPYPALKSISDELNNNITQMMQQFGRFVVFAAEHALLVLTCNSALKEGDRTTEKDFDKTKNAFSRLLAGFDHFKTYLAKVELKTALSSAPVFGGLKQIIDKIGTRNYYKWSVLIFTSRDNALIRKSATADRNTHEHTKTLEGFPETRVLFHWCEDVEGLLDKTDTAKHMQRLTEREVNKALASAKEFDSLDAVGKMNILERKSRRFKRATVKAVFEGKENLYRGECGQIIISGKWNIYFAFSLKTY